MLILTSAYVPATPAAAAAPTSDHLLLTGQAAADFQLPADVRQAVSWRDPGFDLDYTRYQQYAAPLEIHVEGAQLTVVRRAGRQVLVIGVYFPGLRVARGPLLGGSAAIVMAAADALRREAIPTDTSAVISRRAELRLDPGSGRLFYLVVSGAPGVNLFQKIDAETGAVIDSWDGIDHANGMGTGVKGDRKNLLGADPVVASLGSLTTLVNGAWRMQSANGSIVTYDAKGKAAYGPSSGLQPLSDAAKSDWGNDNDWKAGYERPAVDAQYYAALTVSFYRQRFGFDLIGGCPFGAIRNVVHYDEFPGDGFGYDNAFWDGFEYYMVYGDGDGHNTRALSAGQDVVTHELTHAVTQCRADLTYQDEAGALNEAFSDIMATAAEWDLEEPPSSKCRLDAGQARCADWWLGEDVIIDGATKALRDLSNPAAQGQPSHYGDRQFVGTDYDNGGVHYNSSIVNHAFFLLVNGGRNARCSGPTDPQADCDVFVPPIPIAEAEQIFFSGFGMLTANADLCAARDATIAAAGLLYPGSIAHRVGTELAWAAVGRSALGCAVPADFAISLGGRTLALAPATSGKLQLSLQRGTQTGPIDFAVAHAAPTTATTAPAQSPGVMPDDGSLITFDVPGDAASGIYPLLISASDGAQTRYAPAVLIIDGVAPSLGVTRVRFTPSAAVSADGVVPLQVIWTAFDAQSGLASAQLEHSPDGANFAIIYGPGAPTGATSFDTTDGAHYFRVVGSDSVGNVGVSNPTLANLTSFQETSATYTGSWTAFGAPTPWGTTVFSTTRGASATFSFTGTDVAWIASRGPKRGQAKVYLDGALTKVDLYASKQSDRRVVFVASNLAAGAHTLRIVVKGSKRRPRVDIDGFYVLAP